MSPKETWERGIPVQCSNCGYEIYIRLRRGVRIKEAFCENCHLKGTYRRNTEYDVWRRKVSEAKTK